MSSNNNNNIDVLLRWRRWCFVSDELLDHGNITFSTEAIIRFPEAFLPDDLEINDEIIRAWVSCEDNFP